MRKRGKNNLCFLTMKTRHGNRTASMCVYQWNITNGKRAFVFYSLHQLQSTQTEYTKRWFLLQSSGTYSSTARDLISQYESFGKKGMEKNRFLWFIIALKAEAYCSWWYIRMLPLEQTQTWNVLSMRNEHSGASFVPDLVFMLIH